MKQGRAGRDVSESHKVEPKPKGYTPGYASRIGVKEVLTHVPKVAGRGFMAPSPVADTRHKSGSQGRH